MFKNRRQEDKSRVERWCKISVVKSEGIQIIGSLELQLIVNWDKHLEMKMHTGMDGIMNIYSNVKHLRVLNRMRAKNILSPQFLSFIFVLTDWCQQITINKFC